MLTDPPLLTIRRAWSRPAATDLARLAGVQTGQAVDAMEGRGALDAAIKPLDPLHATVIGPAITCDSGPDDNLALFSAILLARPGDVVVAAGEAFQRSAVLGDNLALIARARGVAGIVVDGMMRDLAGLLPVGLPLFCRGITPNSCVRSGPGRVGLPIVAGGVAISPGDVVIGDRDGVVIVPAPDLERILPRIDAVRTAEAEVQARIRAGVTSLGGIDELLKSDRVRWVD